MNAASPALRELIRMGRSGEERVPRSLREERAWHDLNSGSDSWLSLARALQGDEIEHLIRGLILYGRATGRYHEGRFSPITSLFWSIGMDYPEREAALGAWIVAHRVNPNDPFGTIDDGQAHTLREFHERERIRLRASLDAVPSKRQARAQSLHRRRPARAAISATSRTRRLAKGRN